MNAQLTPEDVSTPVSTLSGHFAACVMKATHYLVMEGHVQILTSVPKADMDASKSV